MTVNRKHNFSTIEGSYNRHRDLLKSGEDLSGLTAKNEWDEIWNYAKIKDQEEAQAKRNKKLSQKIQFNNDLKQQILENKRRKIKEQQELKAKEREMMEEIQRKIKWEDNKKIFSKMKAQDQIHFNDSVLLQKEQTKKQMHDQQRKYEKSLIDKTNREIEQEKQREMLRKQKVAKENEKLVKFSQSKGKVLGKKRLSKEQIEQDLKDQEEYRKIFERQEVEKKQRYLKIKQAFDNQPTHIPQGRIKNIYGLTAPEEERHMYNRMKKEEAKDKADKYLNKVEKLQKQKELREYLTKLLKCLSREEPVSPREPKGIPQPSDDSQDSMKENNNEDNPEKDPDTTEE